jgi:transcriptional repressor of cell division inhibition gene dicB
MTTQEAKDLFGGTRKLAEALGITEQAVHQWGESVPELRVFQIKVLSGDAK